MTINKHTLDLAHKWAKDVHPGHHPEAVATAEVIMSLPEEIVDGDKLREVIDRWTAEPLTSETGSEMIRQLEALLPAPAPRVEIRLGAWAMHPEHGKVLITSTRPDNGGNVKVTVENSDSAYGAAPEWVSPADLSPLPDAQGDSDSDQGSNRQGTLNSSPEPQPGEAWVINGLGGKMNAIRTRGGWVGEYGNYSDQYANRTPLRRLVPDQEPRVLTTVEDYENAAVGTIAQRNNGITREKLDDDEWGAVGSIRLLNNEEMAFSARTVLWEPEA